MRIPIVIGLLAITFTASAQSPSFQIHGFIVARGIHVKAQPSWTTGGFGRFDVGAPNIDDRRTENVEIGQLGFDWMPARWLLLHGDGLVRREPSGTRGRRGGLVQAYADVFNEKFRLRAGAFWLPTSRENLDPMWNSRYSITYSALNTWIGEEFRPIGVDLQYSPNFYLTFGATAFRGNDTMGTLLADRGWTSGNRLTVYNEDLPLPPPEQHSTRPIGSDLDGRNGYAERVRFQLPERALVQFAHIDNRAELVPLIRGQEPWRTRFDVVGATIGLTGPATVAAEWSRGTTTVGFPGGRFTLDFDTVYVLFSAKSGPNRWTARAERFATRSHNRRPNDPSREDGHAFTVAFFRNSSDHVRSGLEYTKVVADRRAAALRGFNADTGGSTITLELRYEF